MGVKRTRKDTAEKDGNPGQTEGQEGIQEFDDKEKTERSAAEAEDGGNDKPQDEVKENKVKGNKRTKKDAGDAKSNEPKDKKSGKENKKTSEMIFFPSILLFRYALSQILINIQQCSQTKSLLQFSMQTPSSP